MFNTTKPHLLALKLLALNANLQFAKFLLRQSTVCWFSTVISSKCSTPASIPHSTMLTPILFTLSMNDCRDTDKTQLISNSHFCLMRLLTLFWHWHTCRHLVCMWNLDFDSRFPKKNQCNEDEKPKKDPRHLTYRLTHKPRGQEKNNRSHWTSQRHVY